MTASWKPKLIDHLDCLMQVTEVEYEILNILEFDSTRKRMSVICRSSEGKLWLYCKVRLPVLPGRASSLPQAPPYLKSSMQCLRSQTHPMQHSSSRWACQHAAAVRGAHMHTASRCAAAQLPSYGLSNWSASCRSLR